MTDRLKEQALAAREHVTSKIIDRMMALKFEADLPERPKFDAVINDCYDILVGIVDELKEEK